jgi:hypothetical protein
LASLVAATRAPFVLRDAARKAPCKTGVARTSDEVTATLKCLLNDQLLREVIKANSNPTGGPIPHEVLPNWATRWAKDVGTDTYSIAIVYVGDRASFDFIVLASPDGVHGVFKHKSVEYHD